MILEQVHEMANRLLPGVKEIRHHLHAYPELSFREYNTCAFVSEKLTALGIKHLAGVAGTGILGTIEGKNPSGRCIALRADMDALPIQEENEVSYKSKNAGVMHACGHDVHTSCLLGAAHILHELRNEWEGTVKLIFQPGEEKHPGGASLMIKAGVLENPEPEAIFALHVHPALPSGQVSLRSGQCLASADEIYITIEGKGGHAALPHLSVDPISIAALVITGLQQVVSRKGNPIIPSVLTFGKIAGGSATNVIPEKVELMGTFRTMNEKWRAEAHRWIIEFTEQTCAAYGAKATVMIPAGYPFLNNDPALATKVEGWLNAYLGNANVHEVEMRMASEDFSFYAQHIPGCFFRIGTSKNVAQFTSQVHTPQFDIDEDAIKTGMGAMAWIALCALGNT